MPVIEDVIEDDNNGGLNLPKIEEDSVIFWIVRQVGQYRERDQFNEQTPEESLSC